MAPKVEFEKVAEILNTTTHQAPIAKQGGASCYPSACMNGGTCYTSSTTTASYNSPICVRKKNLKN
jgi:hypothetical protein